MKSREEKEKIINNNIKNFLKSLNIKFKTIEYYMEAFTHSSYANERKSKVPISYERLEFLGDSILGKIVSEYIYMKHPNLTPGEMSLMKSKIVSKTNLAKIGKKLKLEKLVYSGMGNFELTESIYEDLIESFIAALYLDVSEKVVKDFVLKQICAKFSFNGANTLKDFKTRLQESIQITRKRKIKYNLISTKRVNEKMFFKVKVKYIDTNEILGWGEGNSKKEAEQNAAKMALKKLVSSKKEIL